VSEEKQKFTDVVPPAKFEDVEPITQDTQLDSNLQQQITDEMTRVGMDNLKQLCIQNEFDIAGVKYTGNKLTPKAMRELRKAEKDFTDATKGEVSDDFFEDQRLALLQVKAFIHLGMTPEQFEDTDVPLLQTVITAREMRARGWFRI
jgi:hypothetical protein